MAEYNLSVLTQFTESHKKILRNVNHLAKTFQTTKQVFYSSKAPWRDLKQTNALLF